MQQSHQHCGDGIGGRLKELALENRPFLCYKCKWHYLEPDIKTQQPSQQLPVSWENLWWQRLMIFFLFLNCLHHKRYQEQDAENILYCLILPLYPGRVGACIKSTFHKLICVCALSGSWALLCCMVSSSFTCCLVEGTEGEWFHFQTENVLLPFLFIPLPLPLPPPPSCFLWGSPTAAALLHNLISSMQTLEDHLRAALLLYALWSQHSLQSFHELCSGSPSSFLNKIFLFQEKNGHSTALPPPS